MGLNSGGKTKRLPLIVIYGDEEFQKQTVLQKMLDELLPPDVDRAMALSQYDGTASEDQGGPSYPAIADDIATLPFLADRRVIVVRDADKFVSSCREKLEKLVETAPPTGTLILECQSFPKTTRLYKSAVAAGAKIHECKRLNRRGAAEFAMDEARKHGKRLDPASAYQLVDMVGQDLGVISGEIEKLSLYAAKRDMITGADVNDLVGQSREEKIFAVVESAATGQLAHSLRLWHQVLATDAQAVYRALGGMAFKIRQWLAAQRMAATGMPANAIAPKFMMWGRERELEAILRRLSARQLVILLAALADLDTQAKSGARSIETGIEGVLIQVANAAA